MGASTYSVIEDDGPDLQEGVACFDAETGKLLWKQTFNDFLSDTIYLRYATASPAIDPETGNVFMQGTQGILAAFTADGAPLWSHSLMEKFGRLTFPNSRTASPWWIRTWSSPAASPATGVPRRRGGPLLRLRQGDRRTGLVLEPGWPADGQFVFPSLPHLVRGKRVLIAASGDGSVVCLNARTGEPHLAGAPGQGRHQRHAAGAQQRQGHLHLRHPV
jgi:hypothetical protein